MIRRWHPGPTRRDRGQDREEGYTLQELGVAVTLLALLFTMTVPVMSTLFRTVSYVNNTYDNQSQLLPVSTNLQRLIRSMVSPAPTLATGQPVPPLGTYTANNSANNLIVQSSPVVLTGLTPTSLTLFTNIGDPNGPARVVARLLGSTFTVTLARATPHTCPGVSNGTACSWGSAMPLITVNHVVNSTVFQYYLNGAGNQPVANDTTTFATCDTSTCNAAQVEDVQVDLRVGGTGQGGQAEDQTVVYELSASSQTYDPAVG